MRVAADRRVAGIAPQTLLAMHRLLKRRLVNVQIPGLPRREFVRQAGLAVTGETFKVGVVPLRKSVGQRRRGEN